MGINYYQPLRVKALDYIPNFKQSTVTPLTHLYSIYDMPGKRMNLSRGWEIFPKGIYNILKTVKNEFNNIEVVISENGIGISNETQFKNKNGIIQDEYRIQFIKEHLYWVHKAINEGVNCVGYHTWAYIDNWSWNNAYKNRYGLYELDLKTSKRIQKLSLSWIKKVYKDNTLEFNKEEIIDEIN